MDCLSDNEKQYINDACNAYMHGMATDEQKLVWKLANAIHSIRLKWISDDIERAREILYEHDFTVNNIEIN